MRTEFVDMSEINRRIEKEIYDKNEFKKALEWTQKHCKEGINVNTGKNIVDEKRKLWEWETVVKMTLIFRDLMIGNPELKKIGYGEEALGRNAIVSGF